LVLPVLNEKDVLEIPEDIRKGVVFHYPQTIEDALGILLEKKGPGKVNSSRKQGAGAL
jgi:ATP-dependent Lon protease